jgi:putative holliday junction resolvase
LDQVTVQRPRIAAVDYGMKRVGLAVADPLRLFAQPLGTYSPDEAVSELRDLAAGDGLEVVILGLPLMPDDSPGMMTDRVEEYARRLRNALSGCEIVLQDERESSIRARAAIIDAGARRKARSDRGRVDAAAAAIILQDYLDEQV